jgi:hypothetical protein
VFINGVERGLTPVTFENLMPGEHSITLIKEGYGERQFSVTVFSASRLVVSIELKEARGFTLVSVYKAEDAPGMPAFYPQVFTSALGANTPINLSYENRTLLNLPTGYHTIKARAFGWEDTEVTVLVNENITVPADIFMKSATFNMGNITQSRRRFNPKNPNNLGSTDYRFEVSAPGSGSITITDKSGFTVHESQLNNFDTWVQHITWNGKDHDGNPLPEGVYTILIEGFPITETPSEPQRAIQLTIETSIDYSIEIFPLSFASGIPGLALSPTPHTLPWGGYQMEAGMLFGRFVLPEDNDDNDVFNGVPFGIGFRLSPLERLESSAYFNVNPRLENLTGWGITGSLKYNILNANNIPLAFATGVSYAWASENGEIPLSPGRGVGVFTPLSLELKMFSFIFSPCVFWRGPEGAIPALLLSGGILYRSGWINAGVSARGEIDFTENTKPRFLTGAEGRFYPPPSNFIISLHAGMWAQDSSAGGYGGVGIGIIY